LHQLISLTVFQSLNGQVPYLLRSALPNGLPKLKSLNIDQNYTERPDPDVEGGLWYEKRAGKFRESEANNAALPSWNGIYMRSIVRGAPNLEEIGFLDQRNIAKFVS